MFPPRVLRFVRSFGSWPSYARERSTWPRFLAREPPLHNNYRLMGREAANACWNEANSFEPTWNQPTDRAEAQWTCTSSFRVDAGEWQQLTRGRSSSLPLPRPDFMALEIVWRLEHKTPAKNRSLDTVLTKVLSFPTNFNRRTWEDEQTLG